MPPPTAVHGASRSALVRWTPV
ncbi:MAG: hypothetical protein EOS60_32085 [Mesorhizobium sp.]|nr:MAG: hypothetical protein EOS60_32085 [Mesorhizobium sp.]